MPPRPLPVIAGVVRAAVSGVTPSGQKWVNVHHLQYAAGASTPGLVEVTAVDALLVRLYSGTAFAGGAAWFNNCAGGVSLTAIDYTVLDGTSLGFSFTKNIVGLTGSSLPSECAPVLTLLSGRRGRRYRGRVFMPCPNQSSVQANGTLQSSVTSTVQIQYTGMIAAMQAIQWAPVVASYGHGSYLGTPTTWPPFATPITAARMDAHVDVQRRRKN